MDHSLCDELLELKRLSNETFRRIGNDLYDLKNDNEVDVINGSKRTMKVKELVHEMHTDIKGIKSEIQGMSSEVESIKSTITFLIDFSKLHHLMKKYKLYWIIGLIILIGWGISVKDLLLKII